MKILVTGAAGFIGSYVARALLWRGDDVVGIDNFNDYYPRNCKEINTDLVNMASEGKPIYTDAKIINPIYEKIESFYKVKPLKDRGVYKFYDGDITNFELLTELFSKEKPDAVIHLAAMAGVPYSTKNPRIYAQVNVDGTVNLLTLAKEHNLKRFVFGSSSSVYGNREDKKVTEEDDISKAVSVYGASKVSGEVLAHAFYTIFGLSITVDRIFGPIYGPLQRPYGMFHQRAINYCHNNKTLTIYGRNGLETAKDSTYIDDQVNGLLACLDCDYKFEVFNIGTSDPKSINYWIDTVEKGFDKKLNYELIEKDVADVISSADISKAKRMLGYEPHTNMYDGIKRQVEVFKVMPKWYQTMDNV